MLPQKRKFKATTNSKHNLPVAENLLGQTFTPSSPNEVWVTDITYIPTGEGWLYLAGVKDVFTCEIVGYAMSKRMTQELTGRALFRAVQQKRPAAGLIHHSDRGSQYCAHLVTGHVTNPSLLSCRPSGTPHHAPSDRCRLSGQRGCHFRFGRQSGNGCH